MARIELSNIVVRYPLFTTGRQRSILGFAANRASFGRIARDAGDIPVVDALDGVSIKLKEGDRLALVGRNGSGKTTMLKVCAGLVLPNSGDAVIQGTRASILNPGAGLDHERTGLENIEFVGRLLGVPKARIKALEEDVAEFTELGEFLALPIRTYSAGMMVRLSFALATSVERDIIIVDELIGAGDAHFVEKAATRVRALFERAKILVLATHSGTIVSQLCNQALWLDRGREVMSGAPEEVWDAYVQERRPEGWSR
ncbi:MAG: ATP-binding cassette domain-containing protein [Alphaproteobacteria bacterium]|nr:ATP-binding cassette domain-containing protein [Alphaproteobacteria bacterium]